MKLSFKFKQKLSQQQINIIEELSFHTTKIYNTANYICRETEYKSYTKLEKELKSNWHNEYLHSHNYQQCLKILEQNWKSYFASIKDYKKNSSKYKGMPQPPKYKNNKDKKNEVIFTNLAIRYQDGLLKLSLSKKIKEKFQVQSLNFAIESSKIPVNFSEIQQIKIKWDISDKEWYLIIIYNQQEANITENFKNIMAVDLGLDNIATLTFMDNKECIIVDGKEAKSKNSYYNKEIARLTSVAMKQQGDSNFFKRTKKIVKLQKKRNNYMNDFVHKVSKKIVDYAIWNECKTIVVGDISGIKQNNGTKTFVQIPIQKIVDKLKYKAELLGIEVVLQEESYTSGCSALDMEEINKQNYDKTRRIQRGLFQSKSGILINADMNGSLNILRKYTKCTPRAIENVRDNGFLNNPVRIRVV
ncbi:RNA-guided endonuclease InsQ/TnpB family protein [Paenibacillus naphthalenovorans]|uniref:Putative transposase n=1 Tax=Paenibacillus naphthalenovorans TaxID=162209 RepID=A0A0U2W9U5_9BACL|nr:RNA-guided endonuclease TnpB family protein [Paenibacillus naphthalenovorans]ALS22138.1 putative transposase [Paenibacillus naphthalenovorans]